MRRRRPQARRTLVYANISPASSCEANRALGPPSLPRLPEETASGVRRRSRGPPLTALQFDWLVSQGAVTVAEAGPERAEPSRAGPGALLVGGRG